MKILQKMSQVASSTTQSASAVQAVSRRIPNNDAGVCVGVGGGGYGETEWEAREVSAQKK